MKRNKVKIRKLQREYVASRIMKCSTGYLTKKLEKLNTTLAEVLESEKLENKRKHNSCFNEDNIEIFYNSAHLSSSIERHLKDIYVVDSDNALLKSHQANINKEMKIFLEDKIKEIKDYYLINNQNLTNVDVTVTTRMQNSYQRLFHSERRIEIYVQLISEKGRLKFLYPNPITQKFQELPIKTTKNGFIINGNKFLLTPCATTKIKLTNKNFKKLIESKLHKPLSLDRDKMGWFIKTGDINYHIHTKYLGWLYIPDNHPDEIMQKPFNKLGSRIIKKCIESIKKQKIEEEKRRLELKHKETIYSNLNKLFLDFQTSREVGNCEPGTQELYVIARNKLKLSPEDGDCAIRADIIRNIVTTTHKHFERNFDNLLFSIARQTNLFKNAV